ncbi:MAG TPA: hypothetical protein VK797_16125 [Tepidisphaeraceae bacterium]|nr:hypothetical protein [Tepidisphaeraceae bacterium]
MRPLDYAHIDFRDEAVAASRELLSRRGLPEQANLAELGTSCCLPAPGETGS